MAPITHPATAQAETAIRDTIQSLYNVMLHTSAYDAAGPHTSLDALVAEVRVLSKALQDVSDVARRDGGDADADGGGGGGGLPSVPQDLVQYVEAGRNPDIYTREFVELVRKTNQIRAGKQAAFADFQAVLAGQIRSALPELRPDVDRVMAAASSSPSPADAAADTNATTATGAATATVATTATAAARASAPPPASAAAAAAAKASASASPPAALDATPSAPDTPSATSGPNTVAPTTIDMLGILPSTPQPVGTAAGASGAGVAGAADSNPDAMQP